MFDAMVLVLLLILVFEEQCRSDTDVRGENGRNAHWKKLCAKSAAEWPIVSVYLM